MYLVIIVESNSEEFFRVCSGSETLVLTRTFNDISFVYGCWLRDWIRGSFSCVKVLACACLSVRVMVVRERGNYRGREFPVPSVLAHKASADTFIQLGFFEHCCLIHIYGLNFSFYSSLNCTSSLACLCWFSPFMYCNLRLRFPLGMQFMVTNRGKQHYPLHNSIISFSSFNIKLKYL